MRKRLTDGLSRAWDRATAGGARCGLRLLTLTVRHSGDLDRDRRALVDGWRGFYKRAHAWLGRYAYAAVWEVTPGRDGLGHVHLHVAVIWPRFVPYGKVRTLWLRACPESERISIVGGSGGVEKAANYLAKYLSKGVELGGFNDELQASILATFYNAHLVLTSRKFWGPKTCDCCGQPWRRVLFSWGDVLHQHPGIAVECRRSVEDSGPGHPDGLLGGQRSLALPDRFGLVLHRW